MKFGKNLQKVIDVSDPEWAPYWTNYKMLKVSVAIVRVSCYRVKKSILFSLYMVSLWQGYGDNFEENKV